MTIKKISQLPLFRGISESELSECLSALNSHEKNYKKGSLILNSGGTTTQLGIVLTGSVTIENNDIWGNCTILSHVGEGHTFAETYALLAKEVMLVDVRANEDCKVLFINIGKLLPFIAPDAGASSIHTPSWAQKLLRNLLIISSQKNIALSGRSFHTAPKSARGRLLSYLNSVSLQKHSTEFDIPFNRQQLADYLNLERTNMSKELTKMQRDGIIECRKNHFKLLNVDEYDTMI